MSRGAAVERALERGVCRRLGFVEVALEELAPFGALRLLRFQIGGDLVRARRVESDVDHSLVDGDRLLPSRRALPRKSDRARGACSPPPRSLVAPAAWISISSNLATPAQAVLVLVARAGSLQLSFDVRAGFRLRRYGREHGPGQLVPESRVLGLLLESSKQLADSLNTHRHSGFLP